MGYRQAFAGRPRRVKVIAFEEHYLLPAIADAHPNTPSRVFAAMRGDGSENSGQQGGWPAGIEDLGDHRIAAMDEAGIDMQILSNVPGAEALPSSLAVELARQANDTVAAAITKHPDRFRGFATLPLGDPAAAAAELERAVRDDGFVGALINGHVNGRYLDDTFSGRCSNPPNRSASRSISIPRCRRNR